MCGICGVIDFSGAPVAVPELKAMSDAIAHRGPDGEGFFTKENVGFGHRRLAIIDLSPEGKQPRVTPDGHLAISYNGELYNYRELRKELQSLGHRFTSETDTEVLILSWLQWGPSSVEKFNGMFAFAMWDDRDKSVHLVRDRYGIKPLYLGTFGSKILFGSEQKAILANSNSKNTLDKKALFEYFTFQNIFTDRTLVEGINILPAGCMLRIDTRNQANQKLTRYWDFHFSSSDSNIDEREYEEELDRLLQQAVSRQLMSDVPLGSYLSGGMDSGTITALATREIKDLKTFTVGFDLSSASGLELGFDERRRAEAMSALFKTEHYEMVLKAGDMERALSAVTRAIEEPRVGQSYPNYYAAQLASKFVKVVLSGAGGDELFAGYPWRYFRSASAETFNEYIDDYYLYWQRMLPNTDLKRAFSPIWQDVEDVWTKDIFRDVFTNHANELSTPSDFINHSLYFEAKTFLHGLLVVEDKLSMAHSIESRVPFLDNDLVDFAMALPLEMKLKNLDKISRLNENEVEQKMSKSSSIEADGKMILRKVMSRYIPRKITDAQKQGFSAPDASWFQGESIDFVQNVIKNKKSRIYTYLDFDTVNQLVDEHIGGTRNRRLLIWSFLTLESNLGQKQE
jgi:asparagine synthase (glutamine-hydrolysing)